MGTLTQCIRRAGKAIDSNDAAEISRVRDQLKSEGMSEQDAAKEAVAIHMGEVARERDEILRGTPVSPDALPALKNFTQYEIGISEKKQGYKKTAETQTQESQPKRAVSNPGEDVVEGNKLGFIPELRVAVEGQYKGKGRVIQTTNMGNVDDQFNAIDEILAAHPNAHKSVENWSAMQAEAYSSSEVPVPPYAFIKGLKSGAATKLLRKLTPGQIEDASHGFENARAFREAYTSKQLDEVTTAKLFLWSFLSRGVSPYTQESLFIDAFNGIDVWAKKAARGEFTEADVPAFKEWAATTAPKGSGQPGAGSAHNLNAYGASWLVKMSEKAPSGKSKLLTLHEMIEDPDATGPEIRREYQRMVESSGIDNKVVSFTLLVAGFDDIMVLDRVQIRQLWDDGRFADRNLYDGVKKKGVSGALPGTSLASLVSGARGIMIYEAIERAIAEKIKPIYKSLGRPQHASIGRYHWETWVAHSEQEASHGTLDAILKHAKGDHDAIHRVTAKEGEYGAYAYGARYGVDTDGAGFFDYTLPNESMVRFTVDGFRKYLTEVKKAGRKVVPSKFKVTESGNAPWYTRPEVNRDALEKLAREFAVEERPVQEVQGSGAVRGPDLNQESSDLGQVNEPDTDYSKAVFYEEPSKQRPNTRESQKSVGRSALRDLLGRLDRIVQGRSSSDTGGSRTEVLASRLAAGFREGKPNQLVGQEVSSAEDFATIAQVYRDPRFETLRFVFTKDGKVVGERAYSSRMPASVTFGDAQGMVDSVREQKEALGADGYYLMHNHPSGKSEPSLADRRFTSALSSRVSGLKSHVVIDFNEYSVIENDGNVETYEKDLNAEDFYANPEVDSDLLGLTITSEAQAGEIARMVASPDRAVVIVNNAQGKVQLVTSISPETLSILGDDTSAGRKAVATLRAILRETGSGGNMFLVMPEGARARDYRDIVREEGADLFTDIFLAEGRSVKPFPGGDVNDQLMKKSTVGVSERLEGLPETVTVDGQEVKFESFAPAQKAAKAYAKKAGIDYNPPTKYAPLSKERGQKIAREFELMEHNPSDPEVKAAYEAMIDETLAQYDAILDTGLEVRFIKGEDPYGNPRNAILDIVENNRMMVFSTQDGYGSNEEMDLSENPMLAPTSYKTADGDPMLANDVFRVVHDYFGHVKNGVGFRARGEENAWQAHASMYTPLARRAMTTETRGQNSVVNFGPNADFNQTANGADTVYADQKIGLLPRWVSEEERLSDRRREDSRKYTKGLEGAVVDGRLQVSHFSRRRIERTDPRKAGTGLDRGAKDRFKPQVTYFGITQADENGYRREAGLGFVESKFSIEPQLIYPVNADPEGLWTGPYDQRIQAMKDAGYSGYWADDPQIGKVAVIWDPMQSDDSMDLNVREDAVAYERTDGGFYSSIEKLIAEAKIPGLKPSKRNPAGAIRASSWMQYLRNRSVKQEEWDWTGMRQILNENPRVKYTREEMLQMIRQTKVRIGDVVAGDGGATPIGGGFDKEEPTGNFIPDENVVDKYHRLIMGDYMADRELSSDVKYAISTDFGADEKNGLWFWRTPGSEYAIVGDANSALYTIMGFDGDEAIPSMSTPERGIDSFAEAKVRLRMYERDEHSANDQDTEAQWEEYVIPGSYENYREFKVTLPVMPDRFVKREHFRTPNVVGFLRTTDRDKGKTFLIDELQSDWHQSGRQKGYRKRDYETVTRERRDSGIAMEGAQRDISDYLQENMPEYENAVEISYGLQKLFVKEAMPKRRDISMSSRLAAARSFLAEDHPKELVSLIEKLRSIVKLDTDLFKEGQMAPDAPFKNDAWISLMAKRAAYEAAAGGYDKIQWASSEEVIDRWSDGAAELYQNTYDKKMPAIIRRMMGVVPKKVRRIDFNNYSPATGPMLVNKETGGFRSIADVALYSEGKVGDSITDGIDLKNPTKEQAMMLAENWIGDSSVNWELMSNDEFDEFMNTSSVWEVEITPEIRKKILDEGLPMFRSDGGSGRGLGAEGLRKALKNMPENLMERVSYVETMADLPERMSDEMRRQGISSIAGYYDRKTDRVWLVGENIRSKKDAEVTLLHESVGHRGIERVMGQEIGAFLQQVRAARGRDGVVSAAYDYVDRMYKDAPDVVKAAEVVAYISESDPQHNLVQRMVQWMRRTLRSLGFDVAFTNGDIIEALRRAKDAQAGQTNTSGFFKGDLLARAENTQQTQTPQFRNWFGESQIVNDDGTPKRMFHRTSQSFDRFKAKPDGPSGSVIFLGDDPDNLQNAHNFRESGDNIMPVYVRMENPLMLDEFNVGEMRDRWAVDAKGEFPFVIGERTKQNLQRAGFDGIIAEDVFGIGTEPKEGPGPTYRGANEYIVFDSSQIKSAVGNRGTFDPNTNNILFGSNRSAEMQEQVRRLEAGEIDNAEYTRQVQSIMPIKPFDKVPAAPTVEQMQNALKDSQQDKITGDPKTIPDGTRVGSRLDIPAYTNHDTWVVTVHDGMKTNTGSVIGYMPTAILTDVEFTTDPKAAMSVAKGKPKATFARMHGSWKGSTAKQAENRAKLAMKNPAWVQVGMNPERHSFFYDKSDNRPVVKADEVIQVGALVMAKNPTYGNPTDDQFSVKGLPGVSFRAEDEQQIFDSENDEVNFSMGAETMKNYVIRNMQDQFVHLKNLQKAITEAGGRISESANAYLAEELFHGKAENDLRKMRDDLVTPLATRMAELGVTHDQFDEFLYAMHAPERNAQIAKINEKMPDGGSGMTDREAGKILAQIRASGQMEAMQELEALFRPIIEAQREAILSYGLEDDGMIASWNAAYRHYVPLKGLAEDNQFDEYTGPQTGKGYNVKGKESKRAMGRRSRAKSPLSYAIVDLTEKIIKGRKNEVGNALLQLIEDNPNSEYWEIFTDEKPDITRRITKRRNPETGRIEDNVVETSANMGASEQYFTTKRDGKTYYMKLKDPMLMRAMKKLGPQEIGVVLRSMGSVNRVLSSINTSYAPEFVISNFARDYQTALLNTKAESSLGDDGKAAGKKIDLNLKRVWKSMRAIHKSLRSGKYSPDPEKRRMQEWYDEYREAGAQTGYFDRKDIDGQAKDIDRIVQMANGGFTGTAMKWGKATAELVENANMAVENAVRLAAYISAREEGLTQQQAASLAKNMTVNFNRRGEIGTTMNALYMFANASVQGTANFLRTMATTKNGKMDPRWKNLNNAQKIAFGLIAGGYALASVNRMAAGEDDDGENWYDKIPNYERERNIILMKSLFGGEQDGTYWKIPLPYGYNIFHVLGDSMESVVNGGMSIPEAGTHVTLGFLGSFSPIGFSTSEKGMAGVLAKNLTPTPFKPVADIAMNENFFGSRVYRENFPFGTPKPNSSLGSRQTPEYYKDFAMWLNKTSGGSEQRTGEIDVNPDIMAYVVDYYAGSAGTFIDRGVDFGMRLATGTETEQSRTPLVRKISGQVRGYQDTDDFYTRRDEVNQVIEELKVTDDKAEFRKEFGDIISMRPMVRRTESKLKVIRSKRDRVYEDDPPMAEKDKRLKALQEEQDKIIDEFNLAYNKKTRGD